MIAAVLTLAIPQAVRSQERSPLVSKVVELGVAQQVVGAKCPGWSLNQEVIALAVMAVGLAGQRAQLDAVTEAEVSALAEQAKKTSLMESSQCNDLAGQMIADPLNPNRSIPVFLRDLK
ncbi:MAG TPA: hypothetical protein VGV17_24130 [Bosea sp. (in: a-proteobacteria)]|uniref:hypothetical protein n=1 Tax=Bosea sp. (in: a-proteobacteria) TaxID=1871050 RepID=UPI002DDD4ED4|nr:hypothetical protein [Bosea sp. (in: a-proteobacteria)]HEV2556852.1 hypothetical protein [Bosea sp. (in: a-proteobacteria)]